MKRAKPTKLKRASFKRLRNAATISSLAQQEREVLEQLHEIRRLATLAQATAWQNDQTFMVALEENVSVD